MVCPNLACSGFPEYELVEGGADLMVDSANLGDWVVRVVDATLGSGISAQLGAFREGFNEVGLPGALDAWLCAHGSARVGRALDGGGGWGWGRALLVRSLWAMGARAH